MTTIMDDQPDVAAFKGLKGYSCSQHGFWFGFDHCPRCQRQESPSLGFSGFRSSPRTVEQIRTDFIGTNYQTPSLTKLIEELCRAVFREQLHKSMLELLTERNTSEIAAMNAEIQEIKQRQRAYDQQIESLKEINRQLDDRIQLQGQARALLAAKADRRWTDLDARLLNCQQEIQQIKQKQYLTSNEVSMLWSRAFPLADKQPEQPPPKPQWCCEKLQQAYFGADPAKPIVYGGHSFQWCPYCGTRRPDA